MSKFSLEKTIEINAPVSRVWRVFTDPTLTRQIAAEYASEWKVDSALGWKGLDGKMVTNGIVMKIEPEKLLQHTLLNSVDINFVITYEFDEKNGITTLRSREDFTNPVTDKEYADASEGWDAALRAVKETVEKTK